MAIHRSVQARCLAALLGCCVAVDARAETDPAALIDALNAVFGKHEGRRAAHTNGMCVKGTFIPTAEAGDLSKAPHFNGKGPWPVIGRFSMGGGDPAAPNTQKDNARGLALHIDLGNGKTTDMVMISAPVFLAKSPEDFLALLQTVATKDSDKIGAFFKAHPESTRQSAWLNARPLPASYATTTYYGVHAFTLTNSSGEKHVVKWEMVPAGGEVGVTDEEAKAKAPDFYKPELSDRLAKGSAEFALTAILGEASDPVDDPTSFWPVESRKSVGMGTLSITALEDDVTCDAGMFDPTVLVEGIDGPANDTIFPMRSPAYAVSFSRRGK